MQDCYRDAEKRYKRRLAAPRHRRGYTESMGVQKRRVLCHRREQETREELDRTGIFDPYLTPTDGRFECVSASLPTVFLHCSIPGCYVVRAGLSLEEQLQLYHACWYDFPEPPASTNLILHYGSLPKLALAAQDGRWLRRGTEPEWSATDTGGPTAASLLRKLRWTSLGPHYDWTARRYDLAQPHRPLPMSLAELWTRFTALLWRLEGREMPPWQPDAALVNYYAPGDTLGGHRDDAEHDLAKPIVCLSLGLSGVFLMGGLSRAVEPVPILLRSGDVMIMNDEARRCFHGVPRVLNEVDHHFKTHTEHFFSNRPDMKLSILSQGRISVSIRSL